MNKKNKCHKKDAASVFLQKQFDNKLFYTVGKQLETDVSDYSPSSYYSPHSNKRTIVQNVSLQLFSYGVKHNLLSKLNKKMIILKNNIKALKKYFSKYYLYK